MCDLCGDLNKNTESAKRKVKSQALRLTRARSETDYLCLITPSCIVDATIYFQKSAEMMREDVKLVAQLVEEPLRAKVKAHNEASLKNDKDELQAIEEAKAQKDISLLLFSLRTQCRKKNDTDW